jgi:hypothetical protein
MAGPESTKKDEDAQSSNLRVVLSLLSDIERARVVRESAEQQIKSLAETIATMARDLSPAERDKYLERMANVTGIHLHTSRGGDVYEDVIRFFRENSGREWSARQVHEALTGSGPEPDMKSIYNIISYLAKTGRLQRVARGRYVIRGLGVGIEIEGVPDDGTVRPKRK